jgi:microcystin-dependent protein
MTKSCLNWVRNWVVGTVLLLGAMAQPSYAQLSASGTWGGTATGSANAAVITIPNVGQFSDLLGVPLRFIPSAANTGAATINVSSLGATAIQRPSSIGNVALSGGELQASEATCVIYTGTVFQLACNLDMTPIGGTVDLRGSATPRGTLVEDGSAVSRTTYAALFTVIGTTYGVGDGSTTFNLPDSRGTTFAALDGQGVNGLAGRMGATGGCTNSNTLGTLCGSQTHVQSLAELAAHTHTVPLQIQGKVTTDTVGNNSVSNANTTSASTGSSAAMPMLTPMLMGRRAIKY